MWVHVEGATKPPEVDAESSRKWVYVRRNVTHVAATEDRPAHWEWDESKVAKDVWDVLGGAVATERSIAAYTDSVAADNYPAGTLLSVNGNLLRTTQAIARGERIGAQNTVPTTLAEYITEQSKE